MAHPTPYTFITSYSVETILLGMNCVLYAFCVYTLWGQKFISCRLLLIINTIQFLLCAAQITLHTTFLFFMFTVYTADFRPYLHHVSPYILAPAIIYNVNFITGGFLSIWRLYVLYDYDITVCIPAFLVWIAQICTSAVTIRICATTLITSTYFNSVNMLLWAVITMLNLCVAIPICFRLCIAQKNTHIILSSSPYKSIAVILVESGALITLCSVAMMILYACNFVYALISLGTATEVAVASQLLITARHGMLSRGNDTLSPNPSALDSEINVMCSESRHVDLPMTLIKPKTLCSSPPESELQDKESLQLFDDM
ncbi:hypothetical protein HD554DRAFT_2251339 [Boletus coccyginus]|nr:hypothetical protein HD554DRAFT_2251339 [Boletus coccyginus]